MERKVPLSRSAWLRLLEVGTGCVPTHVSLVYMHTHSCVLQERKCGPTSSNLLLLLLFHSLKNGAFLPRFLPLMNGENLPSFLYLSLSFVDKKETSSSDRFSYRAERLRNLYRLYISNIASFGLNETASQESLCET